MTNIPYVPRTRLFIDLDGVGADFDGGYYALFGHWPWDVPDGKMWANVRSVPKFFANLPVLPGFLEAVQEFVDAGYDLAFLTACPSHDYQGVADQKYEWVHTNVPHDILVLPVIKGVNKVRFLQRPGDVLVDDFEKNVLPWRAAGGNGILHKDWAVSKPVVHAIMQLARKERSAQMDLLDPERVARRMRAEHGICA